MEEKNMNQKIVIKTIAILTLLLITQTAFAASVSDITEPVTKIYDLIKGVVSIVGVIALTIAGAMYMFSGSNIQARENAKSMVSYAVVGLVLVWVAPIMVSYLTSPTIG